MRYFIGVDVGGTTTTLAVGNDRREVLHIADQIPTRSEQGPQLLLQTVVEQSVRLMESLGGSINDVAAIGLATPGPATLDGVLLKTPNLDPQQWDQFPIRAELESVYQHRCPGLNVRYIGDGQAAALGEFAIRTQSMTRRDVVAVATSREKELSSLFMVIVGTGLGGGAIQDRKVVRGSMGRAGHAGHISLPPFAFRHEHDQKLLVGNSYCTAESAISLSALTHQLEYRLSLDQWKNHPLKSVRGSFREQAKMLRGLADDSDELALELFDDQARSLGITLLNVNYLGDYDLLVIGGGVCDLSPKVRERYQQRVIESYRQYALDGFRQVVEIEFSVCGDDAPVIGALTSVTVNPT